MYQYFPTLQNLTKNKTKERREVPRISINQMIKAKHVKDQKQSIKRSYQTTIKQVQLPVHQMYHREVGLESRED